MGKPRMPLRDRQILENLFKLKKLSAAEIGQVFGFDTRTILRKRKEWEVKGTITDVKDPPKNAQKITPEHFERLQVYIQEHGERVSLREMVDFLSRECEVKVSISTISKLLSNKSRAAGKGRRKLPAPRTKRSHSEGVSGPVAQSNPNSSIQNGQTGNTLSTGDEAVEERHKQTQANQQEAGEGWVYE